MEWKRERGKLIDQRWSELNHIEAFDCKHGRHVPFIHFNNIPSNDYASSIDEASLQR